MVRFETDPGLNMCPDFASLGYAFVRNLIIQGGNVTDKEAAQQLAGSWTEENVARRAGWVEQQEATRLASELAQQAALEAEQQWELQAEQVAEAERKRPKMNVPQPGRSISDSAEHHPSAYTINRIKCFKHLDLWHLTPEGCLDALKNMWADNEDAFGITKVDDFLTFCPVNSFRTPHNVVADRDLTWRQYGMAKLAFLDLIATYGWPRENITMLVYFFINIEESKVRLRTYGDRIMLTYQDIIRREWHAALDRNRGFDITHVNLDHVREISDDLWNTIQMNEVSLTCLINNTHVKD